MANKQTAIRCSERLEYKVMNKLLWEEEVARARLRVPCGGFLLGPTRAGSQLKGARLSPQGHQVIGVLMNFSFAQTRLVPRNRAIH